MPPIENAVYRIEDLAQHSGATVRTIRAYQDRGLLPKPERRGRANVYHDTHLRRLRQITALLERGFTLASIKELLTVWDAGLGLDGLLGSLVDTESPRPYEAPEPPGSSESSTTITRDELVAYFGVVERGALGESGRAEELDEEALSEAVELGVLLPVSQREGLYHVPSPQELATAGELHTLGVPLGAVAGQLRELRGQLAHMAGQFLDFTSEQILTHYVGHPPAEEKALDAADLRNRLSPLARQSLGAELARAMRELPAGEPPGQTTASGARARPVGPVWRRVDTGSGQGGPSQDGSGGETDTLTVTLPSSTVAAVRELVGPDRAGTADRVAAFIRAATEREIQARALDQLSGRLNSP